MGRACGDACINTHSSKYVNCEAPGHCDGGLFLSIMAEPSDHLLRTFGTLPVESRVLDLGCAHGVHTVALAQLGFDIYACDSSPEAIGELRERLHGTVGAEEAERRISVSSVEALGYPDDFFDWVVAFDVLARKETRETMLEVLKESRRVIRPGGWMYVAVPAVPEGNGTGESRGYAGDSGMEPSFTTRTLDELMAEADFHVAERPSTAVIDGRRMIQAIYRRVDEDTPV